MPSDSKVMVVLRRNDWCEWNAGDPRSTDGLVYAGPWILLTFLYRCTYEECEFASVTADG